jgi:hypothetical protein
MCSSGVGSPGHLTARRDRPVWRGTPRHLREGARAQVLEERRNREKDRAGSLFSLWAGRPGSYGFSATRFGLVSLSWWPTPWQAEADLAGASSGLACWVQVALFFSQGTRAANAYGFCRNRYAERAKEKGSGRQLQHRGKTGKDPAIGGAGLVLC